MKRALFVAGTIAAIIASGQVVAADGKAVFEKSKLGRHAKPGEILSLLEQQA